MDADLNTKEYAASIQAARKTRWLGWPLHYFPSATSTNDILADLAQAGEQAGAMVVTDYQSKGRGRLGRRWIAPARTSLLISLLFRPSWPAERAAWLTMLAGLSALEAIESCTGLRPRLKWPNDLLLRSGEQWLKCGGILLEGQMANGRWEAAIVGIGINVNIKPKDIPPARLPATSLLKESGHIVSRARLLGEILTSLEKRYEAAEQGHSPHQAWERELMTLGKQVVLNRQANTDRQVNADWQVAEPKVATPQPLIGIAVRTDEWGRLIILDRSGREHAVSAGDVTLLVDNSGD
ncbi:MAG: biotin--[acetyl-CoA-carboxylase] ligase [Candidatus Promineifilaceae bacterium]